MRPLLVGECNPYGAAPEHALYPLPAQASGGRLARHLGLSRTEYLRLFDRVNLCTGSWSTKAAREAARKIWHDGGAEGRPFVVLLGRKVGDAFLALSSWDWFEPFFMLPADEQRGAPKYILFPHPSGLNRWWSQPGNAQRARTFADRFLGRSRHIARSVS